MTTNGEVEETGDLVGAWLNMIDRAAGAWIPWPDLTTLADGAAVKQDSVRWCGIFFKPAANPYYATPAAEIAIHHATADTADIIRFDYGPAALRLCLFETVDFDLLRIEGGVDVLKSSHDKRSAVIAGIAAELLNQPPAATAGALPQVTWPFEFPESVEEGSWFSTGPSQEPHTMPSWASRVDGGIRAGRLYFVCFKRRRSGDGRLILLNSHHWFDGQAWAPYEGPRRR